MESSLAITRSKLKAACGFFLGWGRGTDYGNPAWDDDQEISLEDVVASGLRRFYYPERAGRGIYSWSFLKPVTTQFLPADSNTITLPDDFGFLSGTITCAPVGSGTGITWWPLLTTNEAAVRLLYSNFPNATGQPLKAAVVPIRGTQIDAGQRFQLFVYPTPDQEYQIQFEYSILPDALDANTPLPYGGAQHAETILESCLAVAEERQDDSKSVHAEAFQRRLTASMAQDMQAKPQLLGYNMDNSDMQWNRYSVRQWNAIQFNGTTY